MGWIFHICKECDAELIIIGEDIDRKVSFQSAEFFIVEPHTITYKCPECEKETGYDNIIRVELPKPVIPGGNATAEAISYIPIMLEKVIQFVYDLGVRR